ncbi:hypothetical protein Tco_0588602 [Tanacetum coccineum]
MEELPCKLFKGDIHRGMLTVGQEVMLLVKMFFQRNAKFADFEKQIHSLKLQLNATIESHQTLSTIVECLKKESKEKEDKYLDEVIDLQKKNKALDNVIYKMAQRKVHALYDGHTIVKQHDALSVPDIEETIYLVEENIVLTDVNSLVAINDYKNMQKSFMDEYNETLVLKAELAKKHDKIEKNDKDEHVDYLKHTQENVDILHEIVKHARELRPIDSDLASACTFVTRIQELLVYVSATCPSSKHVSDKLVVVTPINKTRKVRFVESSDTSKDNT